MADTSSTSLDLLMGKLKSWQPLSLDVLCADGATKQLAVPAKRRKWQTLQHMLEHLEWVRVEAKRGDKIVGFFENPDFAAAEEIEDLEFSGATGEVAKLLSLMLRAQDVALSRRGNESKAALDALVKVVGIQGTRLQHLERVYASNISMVQSMVKKLGGAADDEIGDMSGAALFELMGMLNRTPDRPPANGTPPAETPESGEG